MEVLAFIVARSMRAVRWPEVDGFRDFQTRWLRIWHLTCERQEPKGKTLKWQKPK